MTPAERYQAELAAGALEPDPVQAAVVGHFEDLYQRLLAPRDESGIRRFLPSFWRSAAAPVRGLYLWGGVGRGKTHLMNAFHDALPFDDKLRIHFHGFMEQVHDELKRLGARQDPLDEVAARLATRTRVICFDEFQVTDIGDAMLLGRLLAALFERGITLVATSNVEPVQLYADGLQRARFLPAIDLIQQHTEVVHFDSATDYRLRALERVPIYLHPLDGKARAGLRECFESLAPEHVESGATLEIKGRPIDTVELADGIAWFEFEAICETARAAADYIEIARRFHTVLVANVPLLDDAARDRVVRFIHLVDELYDRNVNLIVSAAAPPDALYRGERLAPRFDRTRSRLQEMRSREYLARKHLS